MILREFILAHDKDLHNVIRRRENREFLAELISVTISIDNLSPSSTQRAWHVINDDYAIQLCKNCKIREVKWHKNKKKYQKYCSPKCSNSDKDKIELTKENNIKKWGVDNPTKNPDFIKRKEKKIVAKQSSEDRIAKRKLDNLEKYGVEWHTQRPEIKDKISSTVKSTLTVAKGKRRDTMRSRYGVDSYTQHPDFLKKSKQSSLDRYGVEHPMQSDEVKSKLSGVIYDKYGVDNISKRHIAADIQSKMNDKEWLEVEHQTKPIELIATELGVNSSNLCVIFHKFGIKLNTHHHSIFENEIYDFISDNYAGDVRRNIRTVIPPAELDIYLPELNLAIECNGIYWHSETGGGKDKHYHTNKTLECNNNGIHLIHVTDIEWREKTDILKSTLLSLIQRSTRIFARKCKVEISKGFSPDVKAFLIENHIQGYSSCDYNVILSYRGEILQVMTFGKPRFTKMADYELIRLSTKNGYNVIGGASRMFSAFLKIVSVSKIVSYSEADHFGGNIYNVLGFKEIGDVSPTYIYIDKNYNRTYNRYKFQKHKLHKVLDNFDSNKSEWENMKINGYDRYWRPGSKTYIYEN